MQEAMYLAIEYFDTTEENPYWSPDNNGIESKYITLSKSTNHFFFSNKQLEDYLSSYAKSTRKTIRYYRVSEVFPSVKTTTELSFSNDVEAKVRGLDCIAGR